jgi:uncharacterized protein
MSLLLSAAGQPTCMTMRRTDLDHEAMASNTRVDHIPVVCVEPPRGEAQAPLAIWLPALGTNKEWVVPFLAELAEAGFVAVSLDPWQHGERATESPEELRERVYADFRRHMWPILGQTTLDALRVIDWAIDELHAGPTVVAGGVSMGGDDAVALAGIDHRVSRVAAVVASPDWTRPNMHYPADPSVLIAQGSADAYAEWLYESLDPATHLHRYAHGPAMAFESGQEDSHVPAEDALRFQAALRAAHPDAGARVRVTVHAGVAHFGAGDNPTIRRRCIDWLLGPRDGE